MIAHVFKKGNTKYLKRLAIRNSQVGVPLTLDHLTSEDEIGVLEMGMSEKGQIAVGPLVISSIQTLVLSQMLVFHTLR